jgi:hypothetical protein
MGLDMYAYVASKKDQKDEFYETAEFDSTTNEYVNNKISKPVEIAYWRKHPSLHGWMAQLWQKRNPDDMSSFNGIELELTWQDVDDLEQAVRHGQLPFTEGFFFGKPSDNVYYEQDLKFCTDAKAEIFLGFKVFYNSSW